MDRRQEIFIQAFNNGWRGHRQIYYASIFTHDFAKAFFGEGKYCWWSDGELTHCDIPKEEALERIEQKEHDDEFWNEYKPFWQHALQIMVLMEEPLEFLAQYLEEK